MLLIKKTKAVRVCVHVCVCVCVCACVCVSALLHSCDSSGQWPLHGTKHHPFQLSYWPLGKIW